VWLKAGISHSKSSNGVYEIPFNSKYVKIFVSIIKPLI